MHYFINTIWRVDSCDRYAINSAECWNTFKTRKEAEKELLKRKAIAIIKSYISNTFGVFEPDWSDGNQGKVLIEYDYNKSVFDYYINFKYQYYSPIWYLSCKEHTQEIIEKFDAELRLIFDV